VGVSGLLGRCEGCDGRERNVVLDSLALSLVIGLKRKAIANPLGKCGLVLHYL
jgi:hypothetical protein